MPIATRNAHWNDVRNKRKECRQGKQIIRAFVKDIKVPFIGFRSVASTRCKHRGACVVEVHEKPVFSAADIDDALSALRDQAHVPSTVDVVLAPERIADLDDCPAPLHLRLMDP
jgi:hypothetical protein